MEIDLNDNITVVELTGLINDYPIYYKCEYHEAIELIDKYNIKDVKLNYLTKNSKATLLDYNNKNVRIEPGAIIRKNVILEDNVIVLMGAVINIGCHIGENTMIDMNSVIGSKAIIGKNCHIGAGCVIAGVLEPSSLKPVVIEDNVFIGANSVILEGLRVGSGSIIGAGSIVTKDIPSDSLVYGTSAKIIRKIDDEILSKVNINYDLR